MRERTKCGSRKNFPGRQDFDRRVRRLPFVDWGESTVFLPENSTRSSRKKKRSALLFSSGFRDGNLVDEYENVLVHYVETMKQK